MAKSCKKNRYFHHIAEFLSNSISTPFIREWPFILLFMILMGAWGTIQLIYDGMINKTDLSIPSTHILIGRLCIWFLMAYLQAAIIIRTKKWYIKVLFYSIALITFAVQHFLMQNFYDRICPTYLVLLAETTNRESSEFFHQYILSKAIIPTLKMTAFYIILIISLEYLWKKARIKLIKENTSAKCVVSVLILPLLLLGIFHSSVYYKIYRAPSPDHIRFLLHPDDPFTSLYASLRTVQLMGENMKVAIETTTNMELPKVSENIDDSLNIVLIIGESYIKWHSELYGYNLHTNPNLMKEREEKRLFEFHDVVTPSGSTSIAMRNLLCTNNSSAGEIWYNYPYFPAIFKRIGYDVLFWDNQLEMNPKAAFSFTLNSFLYNTDISRLAYTKTNKKSYDLDGDIVKDFKNNVSKFANSHNLVIFHLMGQHHNVNSRFPHETFSVFNADSIQRNESFIDREKKAYIASYDNATIYNDYVINEIISLFKNDNTFLIYLSDHGEEVYDWRDQCGRDGGPLSNNKLKYQFDIPFMIWCSEKYKNRHPDVVKKIQNAQDRPFMSDNLCHILFEVGGIRTSYYRDSLNIISPKYNISSRFIDGQEYEKIRK